MYLYFDLGERVHRRGGRGGRKHVDDLPSGFGGAGREGTAGEKARCQGRAAGALEGSSREQVRPIKAPVSSR